MTTRQGWIMVSILETWIMMKTAKLRGFVHGRIAEIERKKQEPDLHPAPFSDEVYTPSPRRSEKRRDPMGWQLVGAAGKTPMQNHSHSI